MAKIDEKLSALGFTPSSSEANLAIAAEKQPETQNTGTSAKVVPTLQREAELETSVYILYFSNY